LLLLSFALGGKSGGGSGDARPGDVMLTVALHGMMLDMRSGFFVSVS